jgi:Big-like domain-containing protein
LARGAGLGGRGAAVAAVALACLFVLSVTVATAAAATATYSAIETVPVPPASNFAGSGGGDGWAVALSEAAVYNVFHHQDTLQVACHYQSNAEPCYSPETITETGTGDEFATSGHPGMYLDQKTGKLYVYADRWSDGTAGVVCVDTTKASTEPDPFCGFTELTAKGDAPLVGGISGTSAPMLIGDHWYAFSYVNGAGQEGTKNTLLCFDVSTDAACAGQPYAVSLGGGTVSDGGFPSPATAAIGSKVIIPLNINGESRLACFDDSTQSSCGGKWPVTLSFGYAADYGASFPLMDATGKLIGVCLPTGTDQCFNLEGEATATPAGMTSVIGGSDPWNGPAFVLGPRVYLPNGNSNEVECFDYSTDAGCENFPKSFADLGYLYTVNPDPQRPTCIWVNADNGSHQIQDFDAYTGGACGQGTIRVLASQFVVPQPQCTPANYVSLQVLRPEPSTYTKGTVTFDDGDGNPIAGLNPITLDATGTAALAGLALNTPTGLPQFLFTLEGEEGSVGEVEVKLTWEGDYDATCVGGGTHVTGEGGITLEPPTGKNHVGESHTVTANVTDEEGEPAAGAKVDFKITEGPNAGMTAEASTDSEGHATFTYTSSKPGTDQIVATATIEPPVEDTGRMARRAVAALPASYESNAVTEKWVVSPTIKLEPASGTNTVGESHTLTATVTGELGEDVEGAKVDFKVTEGPNGGTTGEASTNSHGQATFTYSSSKTGTDHVVASTTLEEETIEQAALQVRSAAALLEDVTYESNQATETWTEAAKKAAPTVTVTPPAPTGGVLAFGTAHLASSAKACSATSSYLASVSGKDIASVAFTLNGHKLKTVTKSAHGSFSLKVPVKAGKVERLSIHVAFTAAASNHSETITKTLARCAAARPVKTPRFTG